MTSTVEVPPALRGVADRVTPLDLAKITMPGTDRACSGAESLANARGYARRVGVTRLADVTMLDRIGIPTFQAIRPQASTLTVSQGKGLTRTLASVSALMESIELWHAENFPVAGVFLDTVRGIGDSLGYDVDRDLPLEYNSLFHDDLPIEWVTATRLTDGAHVPVPYRLVVLDFREPHGWRARLFQETSNGLASGNTFVEATLHALYEVIERDAVSRAHRAGTAGRAFDPRLLGSAPVDSLLDRFAAAEVSVDVRWLPSPTGLPCVAARIVSPDYQILSGGYGCHLATEIATTRALTEAAQSRLTLISGGRDDLHRGQYRPVYRMLDPVKDAPPGPESIRGQVATAHRTLLDDLAEVQRRATAAFSAPLLVDMSQPEVGACVAKVLVPGAQLSEGVA
ncbi:YcaO-like family protein [Plantactinospora sp. KBS50]|uniref:YcaO-like family protein n=1 Tax=Plantactinospora sp. KBS50 TaxID=2024580 RepID=UPI000BAAF8B9|nr:YcaO-like family protein [Plantactinospora sp. KBS50]ASW53564.1 hypothetical protein CIK06_04250 [Plantactinospora sp. KBS50]